MPTPGAVLEVSTPMSLPPAQPPPLEQSQPPQAKTMISRLYKQHSWSPDAFREQAWLRRKGSSKNRRSKSVTDEDLDELKACIELGFGFDDSSSPEMDQRLSDTLPALGLYHAVNKHYNDTVSKSTTTVPSSSTVSERESTDPSPLGSTSPHNLFGTAGDNPQDVKTRLKQWAQVVGCSVRQSSS
ncbi:hypothetical protein I3843_02G004500 [Carya illinoinensis]|uniref:Uncharacterized protein n=1 Tax=Carya illinoinensis TaxID=32201 RepID=A0A8T1RB32_CARIL|nr:uncharacterized protein LOC122296340 isoform X1 [Carya illinoinensis]KAG2719816.1 hypothetical protein I3760_02G008900 [Carya illinoinensis]KAG6663171.1 hypothetical protein CIPAW_02G008300 [Carya illinoinensis]KAG6724947.1 hypothetical protein I3842_02G009000 [Carya illinoinensis]KAG7990006.1 hypothetical protein I3843_02G004500 [Carya illinoinensis]